MIVPKLAGLVSSDDSHTQEIPEFTTVLVPGISVGLPRTGFDDNSCLPRKFQFHDLDLVFWVKLQLLCLAQKAPPHQIQPTSSASPCMAPVHSPHSPTHNFSPAITQLLVVLWKGTEHPCLGPFLRLDHFLYLAHHRFPFLYSDNSWLPFKARLRTSLSLDVGSMYSLYDNLSTPAYRCWSLVCLPLHPFPVWLCFIWLGQHQARDITVQATLALCVQRVRRCTRQTGRVTCGWQEGSLVWWFWTAVCYYVLRALRMAARFEPAILLLAINLKEITGHVHQMPCVRRLLWCWEQHPAREMVNMKCGPSITKMVHHAVVKLMTLIFINWQEVMFNIEQVRKKYKYMHRKKSGKLFAKMFRMVILLIGWSRVVFL